MYVFPPQLERFQEKLQRQLISFSVSVVPAAGVEPVCIGNYTPVRYDECVIGIFTVQVYHLYQIFFRRQLLSHGEKRCW